MVGKQDHKKERPIKIIKEEMMYKSGTGKCYWHFSILSSEFSTFSCSQNIKIRLNSFFELPSNHKYIMNTAQKEMEDEEKNEENYCENLLPLE